MTLTTPSPQDYSNVPLTNLLTGYPSFQPNQVLTRDHLNKVVGYLEQQERLTRQKLIGIGIVCGLEVKLGQDANNNHEITISSGVGLTSEGYLIYLPEVKYTHSRSFKDNAEYSQFFKPKESGQAQPEPYNDLLEIVGPPGQVSNPPGSIPKPLEDIDLANKVVVLYLEILKTSTNRCSDESCDERGKKWDFTLRTLLIPIATINQILEQHPNICHGLIPPNSPDPLLAVQIKRFAYQNNRLRVLSEIIDRTQFIEAYTVAIQDSSISLAQALDKLYSRYKWLFDWQLGDTTNYFANYSNPNPQQNPLVQKLLGFIVSQQLCVQYVYDLLLDLKATYEELTTRILDLPSQYHCQCNPESTLFPRHLMLGQLSVQSTDPASGIMTYYRHQFIPSIIHNHPGDLLLNIRQLIQRLVLMIERFDTKPHRWQVRIIPSRDSQAPLGKQAIPFYYHVASSRESALVLGGKPLYQYWDFETSKYHWEKALLSYFAHQIHRHLDRHLGSDPPRLYAIRPLLNSLCEYPRLRIEGHVGRKLKDAIKPIQRLRKAYNLPFDILALKLTPAFLDKKKNTVFLPDDRLIADLQALYLTQRNELLHPLQKLIHLLRGLRQPLQSNQPSPSCLEFISQAFLYYRFSYERRTSLVMREYPIPQLEQHLNQIYHEFLSFHVTYLTKLEQLEVQLLTCDIKEFNIQSFIERYQEVCQSSAELTRLINRWGISSWGDMSWFLHESWALTKLDPGQRDLREKFSQLAIELLAYVKPLIHYFLQDGALATWKTLHERLIDRVERLTCFARFTPEHPGIEHIAGTLKGGTFILVYEDTDSNPPADSVFKTIQFTSKASFTVVGDFYLPGRISVESLTPAGSACFNQPSQLPNPSFSQQIKEFYQPPKDPQPIVLHGFSAFQAMLAHPIPITLHQ